MPDMQGKGIGGEMVKIEKKKALDLMERMTKAFYAQNPSEV